MRVTELKRGDRIRIKREFFDYDKQKFEAGRELGFLERNFLPYEGGHTLTFVETVIRLGENYDHNLLVVENAGDVYFELLKKDIVE
jgi:hypothetical protein